MRSNREERRKAGHGPGGGSGVCVSRESKRQQAGRRERQRQENKRERTRNKEENKRISRVVVSSKCKMCLLFSCKPASQNAAQAGKRA